MQEERIEVTLNNSWRRSLPAWLVKLLWPSAVKQFERAVEFELAWRAAAMRVRLALTASERT